MWRFFRKYYILTRMIKFWNVYYHLQIFQRLLLSTVKTYFKMYESFLKIILNKNIFEYNSGLCVHKLFLWIIVYELQEDFININVVLNNTFLYIWLIYSYFNRLQTKKIIQFVCKFYFQCMSKCNFYTDILISIVLF